jgi:glucose/arabinose dehydrogenase
MPNVHALCRAAVLVVFACAFAGVVQAQPGPRLGGPTGPVELQSGGVSYRVVPVAEGLRSPWSIGFLPDGRTILVSEVAGTVRMIRDGRLLPDPVWVVPTDSADSIEGADNPGMRSLAVHPDFASNRLVYLAHVITGDAGNTLAVSRGRLNDTRLTNVEQIFVADAWETSGNVGGRMLFGPDNTLYVTVGDRDRLCCVGYDDPSLRMKAQDLSNDVGKTLRINDDGSVPDDNPFVGRPGARPEIFTYGHRNGYGLAFHPQTGELWQAEIGPLGGDEVNILRPGQNYGWPLVSTGRNYTGTRVSDQPWYRPGMENPELHWVPSISPSSIAFYTGDAFPEWQGSLLVGALTTRNLLRVSYGNPSQDIRRDPLLGDLNVRVRDVAQGPDGLIYIATEASTGGAAGADGMVWRIEPAD